MASPVAPSGASAAYSDLSTSDVNQMAPIEDKMGIPIPSPLSLDKAMFRSTWATAMIILACVGYRVAPTGGGNTVFAVFPIDTDSIDHLAIGATNCDTVFADEGFIHRSELRVPASVQAPYVVVRYNRYLLEAPLSYKEEHGEMKVHISYLRRVNFRELSCRVYVVQGEGKLPATTARANGHDVVHVFAAAPIRAEDFELKAQRAHVRLEGGVIGNRDPAKMVVDEGVLDIMIGADCGDLDLETENAPMILRPESGAVIHSKQAHVTACEVLKMESEENDDGSVTLTTGEGGPKVNANTNMSPLYVKSEPLIVRHFEAQTLYDSSDFAPLATGMMREIGKTVNKRRLTNSTSTAKEQKKVSDIVPFEDRKIFLGEDQKHFHLHDHTINAIKRAKEVLREHRQDSWIIKFSYIGSIFPLASWQITNSPPFMVMEPGRLSFFSLRFLDPAVIRIHLMPSGYLGTPHEMASVNEQRETGFGILREALVEHLSEAVDGIDAMPLYFQPMPFGSAPVLRYRFEKKIVKVDEMNFSDVPGFVGAAGICGVMSFGIAIGFVVFLVHSMFPFMLKMQEEIDSSTVMSTRTTSYLKDSESTWRLLCMQTFRPEYGLLVQWGKRPQAKFFKRFLIQVEANRPSNHSIKLNMRTGDVGVNALNPEMRRLFISIDPTDTRDELRINYHYRVKVSGLDDRRNIMEESGWSNPMCIMPRRPVVYVPFIFFKVFLPANTPSLQLFFNKFLKPVTPNYMPVKITNIRLIDIHRDTQPGPYFLLCFLGTEPTFTELKVTVDQSEHFTLEENAMGQMPQQVNFGKDIEKKKSISGTTFASMESRIVQGPLWAPVLRRKTHLRMGFSLYDEVLGLPVATNLIGFDTMFMNRYKYFGESELILRNDEGVPLAFVTFQADFGKAKSQDDSSAVFIGDYENRRIQEGCETTIMWSDAHPLLKDKSGKLATHVSIDLVDPQDRVISTVTEAHINAGLVAWVVTFQGLSPDAAHFVIKVDDQIVSKSQDVICQKTLLLAELEFVYASFCRMNGMKMARVSAEAAQVYGARVTPVSVCLSEGVRKPLPFESPQYKERRCFRAPQFIMCSQSAIDKPPGVLRTHPVVMNMNIKNDPNIWKRDLLLVWKMDYSYQIADFLCATIFPLLGLGIISMALQSYYGEEVYQLMAVKVYKQLVYALRICLYVFAFMYQAVAFLVFPLLLMGLIVWKFLVQSEYSMEKGPCVDPEGELLKASGLWAQTGPLMHTLLFIAVTHSTITLCCIFYHLIIEEYWMGIQKTVDTVNTYLLLFGLFFLAFYLASCTIWVLLACMINPTLLGYFVMIAGLGIVAYAMLGKLKETSEVVIEALESIIPVCLDTVLDKACARIPEESELQKKIREKEYEDVADAIGDMVAEEGFEAGEYDSVWEALQIETQVTSGGDGDETEVFPAAMSEKIEKLYKGQLKMIPKMKVDVDELMPANIAKNLKKAMRGQLDRMLGMQDEFIATLANESQEKLADIYKETIKSLHDPEYIDLQVLNKLNDTINETIDAKFDMLLNKLLPDSKFSKLRLEASRLAHEWRSAARPEDKLSDFDEVVVKLDKPRVHKGDIAKFFYQIGLFDGFEKSSYAKSTSLVLTDSSLQEKTFKSSQQLTQQMMGKIGKIMNASTFCSARLRDNIFLSLPEILKLFDLLTDEALWWDAFLQMVRDFEIFTDLPEAEFVKKVRNVFDKWSEGDGLVPQQQSTIAVLELTDGGVWLQALQCLLLKMDMCAQYADFKKDEQGWDMEGKANLAYEGFKTDWLKASGNTGFIQKTRIRQFISDLSMDNSQSGGGVCKGIWFEAFLGALDRLRMSVKLSTALNLFLAVDIHKDGFLDLADFSGLIKQFVDLGMWQSAYLAFLKKNSIDLPEEVQTKFWGWLNQGEENPGLVPMKKVCKEIERMVMTSGLLQSVLITTVRLMGVHVNEVELRFLHASFDFNANGFMSFADLLPLVDKLGRRGMPYNRFKQTIAWMGFKFEEEVLYESFAMLDVNQDGLLGFEEFKGGLSVIVAEKLPESILMRIGMDKVAIVKAVLGIVVVMVIAFSFLLLALFSFGGGRVLIAQLQSGFASAITFGAKSESSGGIDPDKAKDVVTSMIARAMGMTSVPR